MKEKARAWNESMLTLDQDPWGHPYKIVLNKLKGGASPMTETMDPQFVQQIVVALFSAGEGTDRIPAPEDHPEWETSWGLPRAS